MASIRHCRLGNPNRQMGLIGRQLHGDAAETCHCPTSLCLRSCPFANSPSVHLLLCGKSVRQCFAAAHEEEAQEAGRVFVERGGGWVGRGEDTCITRPPLTQRSPNWENKDHGDNVLVKTFSFLGGGWNLFCFGSGLLKLLGV